MTGNLLLLVLLSTALPKSGGQAFHNLVPEPFWACCDDFSKKTRCVPGAATLAKDGMFYIFFSQTAARVAVIRPNLYPEITRRSFYKKDKQWVPFVEEGYAFSVNQFTFIRDQSNKWYSFDMVPTQKPDGIVQDACDTPNTWHPVLCADKTPGSPKVTAVASFTRNNAPDQPYVVGYKKRSDATSYSIVWYKGSDATPTSDDNVKGSPPKAVSVFRRDETKKEEKVVSFNEHGFACLFDRNYDSEVFRFVSNLPIDRSIYSPLMPECWRSASYSLGCPQSFCHRNDVDDIYRGKDGDPIILMRGHYVWKLVDRALPLEKPMTSFNVSLLGTTDGWKGYIPYIDAADTVPDISNSHKFVLQFKDKNDYLLVNNPTAPPKGQGMATVFSGVPPAIDFVDAVWFNRALNQLFIFRDDYFWVFEPTISGHAIAWKIVSDKRLIGDHLKGLPANIDGVLSKDDKAYVMKGQWFYELLEKSWDNSKEAQPYHPKLMYGKSGSEGFGFFDTVSECKITDEHLKAIKGRLKLPVAAGGTITTDPSTDSVPSGGSTPSPSGGTTGKGKGGGFFWWLILLLVFPLFLIVSAVIVFFFMLKGKKKIKRKVKGSEMTEEEEKSISGPEHVRSSLRTLTPKSEMKD